MKNDKEIQLIEKYLGWIDENDICNEDELVLIEKELSKMLEDISSLSLGEGYEERMRERVAKSKERLFKLGIKLRKQEKKLQVKGEKKSSEWKAKKKKKIEKLKLKIKEVQGRIRDVEYHKHQEKDI
jgi:hypothetical protein